MSVDRFITGSLEPDVVARALMVLPEILRESLPDDTEVIAEYGWGSNLHPSLLYKEMGVGILWLKTFLADSLRQEIIEPGESDFYLEIPRGRVHFHFDHHGCIRSSGSDYQLETAIWSSKVWDDLDLLDCPGVGLKDVGK